MVNTREEGWKEVRAARFSHAGGEFATAAWETSEKFVPRMVQMARLLPPVNPGTLMFASDLAEWITRGVRGHLKEWVHMADRWHGRQHITPVAEALYGKGDSGVLGKRADACGGDGDCQEHSQHQHPGQHQQTRAGVPPGGQAKQNDYY